MSRSVLVALIIGFSILFTTVFGFTIDRFYPDSTDSGLGSYAAMLGGAQPTEYPVRSLVLFTVYLVVGFGLIYAAISTFTNVLVSNAFVWPGISLVGTSIYKLHYSSLLGVFGSGLNPPLWTLLVEWLAVAGMFALLYSVARKYSLSTA